MQLITLQKEEVIAVDPKKEFKLLESKDIEKSSSVIHEVILTDWFNASVGSAVVIKSSNRAHSDLASDRSNNFMEGAKKATSKQFFEKFNHAMRGKILGGNTKGSFTCEWKEIETSI